MPVAKLGQNKKYLTVLLWLTAFPNGRVKYSYITGHQLQLLHNALLLHPMYVYTLYLLC